MLYIDNQLVVNNNFAQGVTERSGSIVLTPGWHDIYIGFENSGGAYGMSASFTAPGAAKTFIPNSLLRSAPVVTRLETDAASSLVVGDAGLMVTQTTATVVAGPSSGTGLLTLLFGGTGNMQISGSTSLSRFYVGPATASNVPQGLTISSAVTGTSGLQLLGPGTLVLTNAANSFTGDITVGMSGSAAFAYSNSMVTNPGAGGISGFVAAASDAVLGDPANRLILNNGGGFRAMSTLSLSRTLVLGSGTSWSSIQVPAGNTLTFTGSLANTGSGSQLVMSDQGTLRLPNPGPSSWSASLNSVSSPTTLTGGLLVSSGTLEIADGAALGSTSNIVAVSNQTGAVVALSGGITLPNQVVLNLGASSEAGLWAGNGIGTLVSVSGTNTVSGLVNMNTHGGVGAAAGATLNLTGGISLIGRVVAFDGPGSITVSGSAITTSGNAGLYKLGSGTTTITTAVGALPSWGVRDYGGGGAYVFSGTGAVGANGVTDYIMGGGSIRLDNTAVNVVNRLGGSSPLDVRDGTLRFTASPTAAAAESFSTLLSKHGYTNVVVETTGQASTLNFLNLTNNAPDGGSTLLFRSVGTGANFGTAANTVGFGNAPALSPNLLGLGIMSRGLVADGNGWNFATYSQGSIRAFTAYDTTNLNAVSAPATAPTATVQVGSSVTLAGNRTINGMKLTGGGVTLGGAGATLTLTSGGILATGGTSTIASGVVVATGGVEVGLNASDDAVLNVGAPITTTNIITRGGGGVVNITAPIYTTSWYIFTGGTTRLAAGDATLFPGQGTPGQTQNFSVSYGAVVDLAGSAQLVGYLVNSSNNNYANTGGTITSDTPALFAVRTTSNDQLFGGSITGAITNVQAGSGSRWFLSDNPYTGRTAVLSNATVLRDAGRFSATSGIDVNYGGGLYLRNNGQFDLTDRIPDAAPIALRGGYIELQGRAQTASTETVGAVTLAGGVSDVQVIPGGTGVNSAVLTLASLTPAGGGVNIRSATTYGYGLPGNYGRIIITANETAPNAGLVNNILSAAIGVDGADFASYVVGLGVSKLNQTGFPGYDGTVLPASSSPTQNIKLAAGGALSLPAGGLGLNSLVASVSGTVSFAADADVFNLTSGGLLRGTNTLVFGTAANSGRITAGGSTPTGTSTLYVHSNGAGGFTFNSQIVDNGASPVQLNAMLYNSGVVTLSGSNSYTGGTVVNGWLTPGTLTVAATGYVPAGGLTINDATVTQTAGGVIDPANVVTLSGLSTLTLVGANTLAGLSINNQGDSGTITVTTGGTLTLSSGTAITATSMNPQSIATVNGVLDFGGGTRTFVVNPVAYDGRTFAPYTATLNIGGVIQNAGQITVTGGGVLQVGSASTFTGGYSVAAGSGLNINASSTVTSGTVTSGPLGTGTLALASGARLLSGGAFTIANSIAPSGTVTFEGITGLTLSGTISLPAVATFDVVAPQPTLALTGTLTGAGSALVKNGYGILSLTGTNTFDGGVTVNRGTLSVGNASALGTGTLTMAGGALDASVASLTVANPVVWNGGFGFVGTQSLALSGSVTLAQSSTLGVTGTLTVSGPVADGGANLGLTKAGGGFLVLNGTNTYGGTTTVSAGVLSIAGTAALPGWNTAGRYAVTNGAAIAVPNTVGDADVDTMLLTGNFTSGGAIGFDTTAGNRTRSTALAGAVGLAKTGTNGLILTASNSFTGPAIVYSGSLVLQNQFAVQNGILTVQSGASAVFDQAVAGRAFTTGGLAGAGTVSLVNNAATPATVTLTVGGANATTSFAGTLSGSGNLVKVGSGTQTLAGAGITYTGTTTVNAGTLYLNDTTSGTNSPFIVNAGATLVTGGVATTSFGVLGTLTLDGGTYVHATTGNNDAWRVWNGLITINAGGGTINLDNGRGQSSNNNNIYLDAGLAGSGTLTVNATNTYNTNNGLVFRRGTYTFTGPTVVNSGILWINNNSGAGGSLAFASSDVTLNAAGNLRLDVQPSGGAASNATLKSLSGSGTVTLGSQTLTLGNNNGTGSFSGMIQGAGGLTKVGTGTQTLSGSTTFSGATTITGGTLVLANTFALQNSTLTPAPGIVFDQSVTSGSFTLGGLTGSGTLALQNNAGSPGAVALTVGSNNTTSSFAGTLTGPGTVTKIGTGVLRLTSTSALPGGIGATGGTGNLVLAGGVIELGANDFLRPLGTGSDSVQFTGSAGFSAFGGGRTVNLGGAAAEVTWGAGSFVPDGSLLVLSSTGADSTLTFINPIALGSGTRTVQVDNGTALYDAILAGGLSGSAALVKAGSGKLVLSATNTFAGGLTVSAGLVSVSSTAALPGWNVVGRNAVASGAALVVGNAVSDADAVTILTSGSFVSGASFGFDTGAGDRTFAGVASGVAGLVKSGSNTLTLSGANTFTGNTQIVTGTLAITGTGSLGAGSYAGTIANAGTLVHSSSAAQTLSGIISGAGGLQKIGTGTLTLSAANTFTGGMSVSAGLLSLTGANTSTGTASVSAVGTLALGNVNALQNATLNVGALGPQQVTFTVAGTNTYNVGALAGADEVSFGVNTLALGGSNLSGTFSGLLSGSNFTKNGTGTQLLDGPTSNVLSGVITLGGNGMLGFGKTGGAVAAPGNVNITPSTTRAILYTLQDNQFGPLSVVNFTTGSDGRWELKGTTQTIGGLVATSVNTFVQHNEFSPGAAVSGTSTLVINVASGTAYSFAGTMRNYNGGTFALTKLGSGTQTLAGANILYTGTTNVLAGRLIAQNTGSAFDSATINIGSGAVLEFNVTSGSAQLNGQTLIGTGTLVKTGTGDLWFGANGSALNVNLGAGALIDIQGGRLRNEYTAGVWTNNLASMTVGASGTFGVWDANTTINALNGSGLIEKGQGSTHTFAMGVAGGSGTFTGRFAVAAGTIALSKIGTGTQVLAGTATYTGTTTATATRGVLELDFVSHATGTNMLATLTPLTLNGGTLRVKGKATGPTEQTLNGLTLSAGGGALLVNPAGGTSTTVNVGALTTSNAGGSALIGTATGAGAGTVVITTTTTLPATGVYSPRLVFTNGTAFDWATTTTSTPFVLSALASGSYATLAASGSNASQSLLTSGTTLSGALETNTLKIADPAAAQTLTLASATTTLTGGGLLLTGSNAFAVASGTLTAGNGSGAYDLIVQQYSTGTLTIGSAIVNNAANATALTKAGPGTLVLTGTSLYTGITSINSGTLVLGGAATLGASASYSGAITNNGTLLVTTSSNQTLGGAISGYGSLVQSGSGTLTLSVANTFTGGVTLSGGTVAVGNAAALGTGTATMAGGGLAASAASLTVATPQAWSGGFTFGGSQALTTSGSVVILASSTIGVTTSTLTISGTIGDAGANRGFTKSGTGTLVLSGTNLYGGTTTVSAGVLAITGTAALPGWSAGGRYSVANGAVLAVTNAVPDADIEVIAASGNFAAGGLLGYDTTAGNRTSASNIAGVLGVAKLGTNTLTLTGTNRYTGPTSVVSGTLVMSGNLAGAPGLTKSGDGVLALSGSNTYTGTTTVSAGAVLLSGGTVSLPGWDTAGRYAVASGGGIAVLNAVPDADVSTMLATGNFAGGGAIGFDTTAGNRTWSTALPATVGLMKLGANGLFISASNSFTGPTTVYTGSLALQNQFAVQNSVVTVNSGASIFFDQAVTARAFTAGGLAGAGSVSLVNGASAGITLTLGGANATSSFTGSMSGAGGGLVKVGTGTQTLQGTAITYTGTTSLLAGTLILRDTTNNTTQTFASRIVVSSTTTLTSQRTVAGFASRGPVLGNAVTGSGTITIDNAANSPGLTNGGWTTFGVASGLNFNGTININSGVFSRDNTVADAINGTAIVNVAANAVFAAGRGGNSTIGSLNGAGAVATAWSAANVGSITIGNGGLSGTFTGSLNGSGGATDGNLDGGVLNVIKIGAGTQIFAGSATSPYTGFTRAAGGVLELDFANMTTSTNLVGATSALQLAGGTLRVKGKSSGDTAQTVNGLVLQAGGGGLLVNPNGGNSTTVTLGALTTSNAGGSALVGVAPGAGAGTASITTTTALPATGVYSPRIVYTNGTAYDWATTTTTTPFVLSALASGSYVTLATTGTDTNQSLLTASTTLSGARTTNTIKVSDPAAAQSLALAASATTTLTGGGILLTGSNAFAISSGTLTAGNGSGAYDLIVQQYSTGTLTIGSAIVDNAANATAFTKAGPGALLLTGSSTFSGAMSVNSGTVVLGSAGRLGASGTYAGAITLATDSQFFFNSSSNQSFGGAISGYGTLLKSGSGTLTLTGASTLVGPMVVSTGTLVLNNNSAGAGSGGVTLGDASTGTNAVALMSNNGSDPTVNITVSPLGTGSVTIGSSGGGNVNHIYSGTITLNRPTTLLALDTDRTSYSSLITGSVGTLTIAGNRTTLDNSGNNFVGDVLVQSGTLQINAAGAIPDASAVSMPGEATSALFLNIGGGSTETIGSLSGSAAAVVSVHPSVGGYMTLAAGANSASTTFAGTMGNGGGTFALTKVGTGTLTLTGSSTYTGTTTISAGTLEIAGAGRLGTGGTYATAIFNNATFRVATSAAQTLSGAISGSGQLVKASSGLLVLSGSNSYTGDTLLAGGSLELGSTNAIGSTGTISFTGGTLRYSATNALDYSGRFSQAANQAVSIDTNGRDVSFGTALASAGGTLAKSGSGALVLPLNNSYTGATTLTGGTLQVGNGGTTGSLGTTPTVAISSGAVLAFSRTDDYGGPLAAALSGAGGLRLASGTLTLSGTVDLSGPVTISSGRLDFASAANQTLAGVVSGVGSLAKSGAGTLSLTNGSNSFTNGVALTGGALAFASGGLGSGTVAMGAGTTLRWAGGNTQDVSTRVTLPGSGTATFDVGSNDVALATGIGGGSAAALAKAGAGTLTLSGSNGYSGETRINSGTLALAGAGSIASTAVVSIAPGAALDISAVTAALVDVGALYDAGSVILGGKTLRSSVAEFESSQFGGVMSGAGGGFTKTGAGTLSLTSIQSFTGPAAVSGGVLQISDTNLLASASRIDVGEGATLAALAGLTVPSGQTLGGYGTIDGPILFAAGSALSPGGSVGGLDGIDDATLTGGMTYAFEINDANGVAGGPTGWDLFSTTGEITLAATALDQIILDITSLNVAVSGSAANFNPDYNYAWKFLVAGPSNPITFDAGWFDVRSNNFTNSTNGSFSVARGDQINASNLPNFEGGFNNELYVVYAAIPEPGTLTLAGLGLATAAWVAVRRRRRAARSSRLHG